MEDNTFFRKTNWVVYWLLSTFSYWTGNDCFFFSLWSGAKYGDLFFRRVEAQNIGSFKASAIDVVYIWPDNIIFPLIRSSCFLLKVVPWKIKFDSSLVQLLLCANVHWLFAFQRIKLFNAYAMSKMCEASIPVLDIYPISASYAEGTIDGIHYPHSVFYSAEEALEKYLTTWFTALHISGELFLRL